MTHFNSITNLAILFKKHFLKDGKREVQSFLLKPNGELGRIDWKDSATLEDASYVSLRKIGRGDLYSIYEGIAPRITGQAPICGRPDSEDSYIEAYAFNSHDGTCVYYDYQNDKPMPVMVSYYKSLFIRGINMEELLTNSRESGPKTILGKDFLEAFFEVRIPTGFEATALSEVHAAILASEDKALLEEGEAFIKWLIHEEGLPNMSDELLEHLTDNAKVFRTHIQELAEITTKETAMLRGAKFLRQIGENEAVFSYLSVLADTAKSGLACLLLAKYHLEDDFPAEAFKYASKGASLGIGQCCYLAAELCSKRGLNDLTRMYLDMGMELGDGDCYALMSQEIMRFAHSKDLNFFEYKKPKQAAMFFASEGVKHHSTTATVFLSRLLLDFIGDEASDYALQLLHRAEQADDKSALYWLAQYYLHDHVGSEGKDLYLAERYAKKAIVEEGYAFDDCQLLYAEILLEKGDYKKSWSFIEELAEKGNEKAQIKLGQIIAGLEPRYPGIVDPIPSELLDSLKDSKSFYKAILWRAYPEIIAPDKAATMLGRLARKGDHLAFYELAKIYREGPDSIRDEEKARHFEECFKKYRDK